MHKMCKKIVTIVVIVVALVLAILVSFRAQQSLAFIVSVSRFFDVMIPILGVGALIKYLTHNNDSCH